MDALLRSEVRRLTTRLGAMVREQAGEAVYGHVEQLRRLTKAARPGASDPEGAVAELRATVGGLDTAEAYAVAHAFSLFFQVVNLCEERERVRRLQRHEAAPQSLRSLFQELHAAGVSSEALQRVLDELLVQPVLTAHPTEAKRRTALNHIFRLARDIEHPDEALEAMWQTEEVREHGVTPLSEVQNALFFLERTVLATVASFYAEFDAQLHAAYPKVRRRTPFLRFASWVGGDRDGNPFVTPEVSLEAGALHHTRALAHYDAECAALLDELSHASPTPLPRALEAIGEDRYQPSERFRHELVRIRQRLQDPTYTSEGLVADLRAVQAGLLAQKAHRAAHGRLQRLLHQAEAFGLHGLELDFRDHRDKVQNAPDEVVAEMRALRQLRKRYGVGAATRFILSMTTSADDLLAVLKLARKARVEEGLHIVPLFETVGDLEAAPAILETLWKAPRYREHLRACGNLQEVMFGYSDSNKDGGYLAANWFLYRAQKDVAQLADRSGIKVCFFHGKGGSIDRGGGQSYRTLRAQPFAAHGGRVRITEQGEVISLKYSNPLIAQRNLEQLTSAVIASACLPQQGLDHPKLSEWEGRMDELARRSCAAYQALVFGTPEMNAYFWQATPIDLIEHLRLGSRPSRRQRSADLKQLRAIPWVFAWTQSRHLLSAWYGLGSALEDYESQKGGLEALREMYQGWPFFRALLDNAEGSLAKTDLYIARQYAELVESAAVREKVFGLIEREYHRSVGALLRVVHRKHLLETQPVLAESIRLRNPYVDPLNYLQLASLPAWRAGRQTPALRRVLALTSQGIAFGMKSTG